MPDKDYLYVFTRRDLPSSVAACQSIHVSFTFAIHNKDKTWGHYGPTLIYAGVDNESQLRSKLKELGDDAVPFFEPDLDHELTAVAYYGRIKREDIRLL